MGILENVKGVSTEIKNILKYITDINTQLDKTKGKSTAVLDGAKKVNGKQGARVGEGTRMDMGTDNARFSGGNDTAQMFGRIAEQHMGNVRQAQANYDRANRVMTGVETAVSFGNTVGKSMMGMMPDVGATIGRATGYYGAALMSGSGNRQAMARSTFGGLKGGMTGPGSDAAVAATLAAQGMSFSSNPASQYMNTVTAVGSAARFMNMDNTAAAQAIGGMYSGKTSAALMRNMGIFTTDPRTGAARPIGAVMQDVASRLRNGRKLTVEGVNKSFQSGMLGVDLKGLGFSGDQQTLMKQYLIEQAKGHTMDLGSTKGMAQLEKLAGINPQNALQKINTSETAAMTNAEQKYISGMDTAATHIEAMNKALYGAVDALGGFNSYLSTMSGSNVGKGAGDIVSGVVGAAGNIAGMAMFGKMAGGGKLLGGLGSKIGGLGSKSGPILAKPGNFLGEGAGMLGKAGKFISSAKGAGIIGTALSAVTLAGDAMSGNGWGTKQFNHDLGMGIGGVIGGIAGSFLGPGGTVVGGMAGAYLGGAAGDLVGGTGGSPADTKTGGAPTGGSGETKPFSNPTVTQKLSPGGSYLRGTHDGYDFAVSYKPVFAAAAGVVVESGETGGMGKYIIISHGKVDGKEVWTTYMHLSAIAKSSGAVGRGERIATSGETGKGLTGAHLHLSVAEGSKGNRVNPGGYVTGIGGAGTYANTGTKMPDASGSAQSTTADASNSAAQTAGTNPAVVSNAFAGSMATTSNLVSSSQSGISAGESTGVASRNALSPQKSSTMKALQSAGFKGEGLKTAMAIAMAESNGSSSKHTKIGGHDSYGLFQIDFGGTAGASMKQKYHLSSPEDALNPATNAKIAFDKSKSGTDWSGFKSFQSGAYKQYITGAPSAKTGDSYVANDGPVNVHSGEAILTTEQADVWRDAIKQSYNSKGSGNQVTIHVNITQATEAEAKRLATLVKGYLEEDKITSNMGSF